VSPDVRCSVAERNNEAGREAEDVYSPLQSPFSDKLKKYQNRDVKAEYRDIEIPNYP